MITQRRPFLLGLLALLAVSYSNFAIIDAFAPTLSSLFPSRHNIRMTANKMTAATSAATSTDNNEDSQQQQDSTVVTLQTSKNNNNQQITLIGTAHLSEKSNEQVKRLISELEPNVVMIELDPSRLGRIGILDVNEINLDVVSSGEEIEIPEADDDKNDDKQGFLASMGNMFVAPLRDSILEIVSRTARVLLTGMYKDMSKEMKNDQGGGGEFLVAIRAAEACDKTTKLVLGDRSSVTTIRRAAELAWNSGDPLGVLNRLQESNAEQMKELEARVKADMETKNPGVEIDAGALQVAVMESLKEDEQFRDRLFRKLENDVPEFTQAFLKERDYIMSESIRRELENDPKVERVVGVVGLAHVPGMTAQLKEMLDIISE